MEVKKGEGNIKTKDLKLCREDFSIVKSEEVSQEQHQPQQQQSNFKTL